MDDKIEGSLRCRYTARDVPFFFIQPIKMEEASHKPLIVIYYDVISDEEIAVFKKLAQPRVQMVIEIIFQGIIVFINFGLQSFNEQLFRKERPVYAK